MPEQSNPRPSADEAINEARQSLHKLRADLDEVEKKLLFHAEKLQGIDDRIDRLNRRRNTGDAKEGGK